MKLELVSPVFIDTVWVQIADGMAKACDRAVGNIDPDWLWNECRASRAYLLTLMDGDTIKAALVARVDLHKGERHFHILAGCGRELHEWADVIGKDTFWPAFLNCKKVNFEGRNGLAVIPGVKRIGSIYEMEICDER